jgi:hypothetical protein
VVLPQSTLSDLHEGYLKTQQGTITEAVKITATVQLQLKMGERPSSIWAAYYPGGLIYAGFIWAVSI